MKVWLEKNENYIICYSARNGEESIEARDGKPISVYCIDELKQQLIDKDKEIERQIAVNKEMDKMIGEKDKEIAVLNKTIQRISNEIERVNDIQNIDYLSFATQIRHQVCDEIRKFVDDNEEFYEQGYILNIISDEIRKFLDQIEKGE